MEFTKRDGAEALAAAWRPGGCNWPGAHEGGFERAPPSPWSGTSPCHATLASSGHRIVIASGRALLRLCNLCFLPQLTSSSTSPHEGVSPQCLWGRPGVGAGGGQNSPTLLPTKPAVKRERQALDRTCPGGGGSPPGLWLALWASPCLALCAAGGFWPEERALRALLRFQAGVIQVVLAAAPQEGRGGHSGKAARPSH